MTNPEYELVELQQLIQKERSNIDELFDLLERSDIGALLGCVTGIVPDPIGLFWNLYQPRHYSKTGPAPELSAEWEDAILKSLERLYHRHQVSYEPDAGIPVENDFQESLVSGRQLIPGTLRDLITFIHIAAAWAFRIKRAQGGGLDEVALDCLREVDRARVQLSILDSQERGIIKLLDLDPTQTFLLSTYAVGAKALTELGRVQHRQGNYTEALHCIARAVFEASYAAARYVADEPYAAESDMEGVALATSCFLKERLISGLDNITHQEIASVWQKLKEVGQPDSWVRVAQDCNYMLESPELPYIFSNQDGFPVPGIIDWFHDFTVTTDPPLTTVGSPLTWTEFWYGAKVWVSAQLSASEYRKMREEDKKSEAESRLKTYFFGQDWAVLPDRAKDRLITADTLWHSQANIAWEAVISDLRIATEDMCQRFIWQPLSESKGGGQDLLQFVQLKDELDRAEKRPEIAACVQVCRSGYFGNFLKRQNLGQEEVNFLTKQLPDAMGLLRWERNFAEHQSTASWRRNAVEDYVRRFFGIGQRGVLPELARIGRKLRRV